MENKIDLLDFLEYIDPSALNYQEWINIGMALKHEGYTAHDWDLWSKRDPQRYHINECYRKWDTFEGSSNPVTGGTIVQLAKENGWAPNYTFNDIELDWDATIKDKDDFVIVDKNWIEGQEIQYPKHWDPVKDLITYLETLFSSTENVGYVTRTWEKDGKFLPQKGCCDRTAGQLIELLMKCKGDIGAVLGDYNPEVGAWIRFNPLDGQGVKDINVTDYRYALVESDSMELEKQNAIIKELELPVACLVHSGGKSIHAIVRIDAADYKEYRKRVDYLYSICKKNGLNIDSQNRNPSRLSRMPGVMRNGKMQFLMGTNLGKANWEEWYEWIESVNDDLPDPEGLDSVWDHLPELAPPLIDGVLRQGHKMLIAGPSKAGKSFALIEMCIAIAEGQKWLGFDCTKGKVMYVNLELDRPSCLHRFKDVYNALHLKPNNLSNVDIWNLRGKSIPMDKLAPKLIRRAIKKDYIAIVIDPIYKVITGDENSADQMANFCNQFDKVCTELGCAVIYCHHHSKGSQGNKKSMDRASGSGVFARDPDALIDLLELELGESHYKYLKNKVACQCCINYLNQHVANWQNDLSQDDMLSQSAMIEYCKQKLGSNYYKELDHLVNEARYSVEQISGWRIEGTLREFPKFSPVNLFFEYPIHVTDDSEVLKDISTEEAPAWQKAMAKRKSPEDKKKERKAAIETAYSACKIDGEVSINTLAEYMGVTEKTVRTRLKEHGSYLISDGIVIEKD